jgi:hypothetical protein
MFANPIEQEAGYRRYFSEEPLSLKIRSLEVKNHNSSVSGDRHHAHAVFSGPSICLLILFWTRTGCTQPTNFQ